MSKKLIEEAKKAISKKFDIPLEEMVAIPYKDGVAVLDGAPGGTYRGSWDKIMNAPAEDYEVKIGGKIYDTRTAMDWELYKSFTAQITPKPDQDTWTLLTGEPLPKFLNHIWGDPRGPFGYWYVGQVKSDLRGSDHGDSDARPRLAVILPCNLDLDASLDSCSLPSEITINGKVYHEDTDN